MSIVPMTIEFRGKTITIRRAEISDAEQVRGVMQTAFKAYQSELNAVSGTIEPVHALTETTADIVSDILAETVLVATDSDTIVGTIRIKSLSPDLAYIYRFGVLPEIKNVGLGSNLLGAAVSIATDGGYKAIALHTNAKYYTLARYYYGKQFFVHSISTDKGYLRALFVKELKQNANYDLSPAFNE